MTTKTLEFTLSIKVDEAAVSQVKDTLVGTEAEQPPLGERLVSLVEEKLSEVGVPGDVTIKFDHRGTYANRATLRGGLNPDEWSLD